MWLGCRVRHSGENEPSLRRNVPWGGTASSSGSRRTVRCPAESEEDVWLDHACRPYPGARGRGPSRALDGPRGRGPSPGFVARNRFIHL